MIDEDKDWLILEQLAPTAVNMCSLTLFHGAVSKTAKTRLRELLQSAILLDADLGFQLFT